MWARERRVWASGGEALASPGLVHTLRKKFARTLRAFRKYRDEDALRQGWDHALEAEEDLGGSYFALLTHPALEKTLAQEAMGTCAHALSRRRLRPASRSERTGSCAFVHRRAGGRARTRAPGADAPDGTAPEAAQARRGTALCGAFHRSGTVGGGPVSAVRACDARVCGGRTGTRRTSSSMRVTMRQPPTRYRHSGAAPVPAVRRSGTPRRRGSSATASRSRRQRKTRCATGQSSARKSLSARHRIQSARPSSRTTSSSV